MTYAEFITRKQQGGESAGFEPLWMPDFLFDFQRSLVDWSLRKGKAAAVPCFVKQLGANAVSQTSLCARRLPVKKWLSNSEYQIDFEHAKGADPAEWPEDLRVQEFPEVRK